ncbi:MAG: hypothetical protein ACFFD4_15830 [Candidatus Odinarchaeota archaeon]
MRDRPINLINTVIDLMSVREQAKKAKREKIVYHGTSPDITIDSTDYYIKTHLWILQSANTNYHHELTDY